MNFKFKIQQYQTDAVEAVVNVFGDQGMRDSAMKTDPDTSNFD